MRTSAISPIQSNEASKAVGATRRVVRTDRMTSIEKKGAADLSFSKILQKSIGEADRLQKKADKAIEELVVSGTKDIAGTMIAVEKANLSLQAMTQIRNKIIEAYQEIMRMQV